MDWVSIHFENVRAAVSACTTEELAKQTLIKMTDQLEQGDSKQSVLEQVKFVFYTKFKGQNLQEPEPVYRSIDDIAKSRFEKRVELTLLDGKYKIEEPLFLTIVAKKTLESQVRTHTEIVQQIIDEKFKTDSETERKDVTQSGRALIKMEMAPTQ